MPKHPERNETIRGILRLIANHYDGLSEGEWIMGRNGGRQVIDAEGFRIEMRAKTPEGAKAAQDVATQMMANRRNAAQTGPAKSAAERDAELQERIRDANAKSMVGIPLNDPTDLKYGANPARHSENAETREYK